MGLPGTRIARRFYRAALERLDDAVFLNAAARNTAAVYLAGYAVECMLKALVVSLVPENRQAEVENRFRGAKAHDFDWLLRLYRQLGGQGMPRVLAADYARVNTWTTEFRYVTSTMKEQETQAFLASARRVVEWANGRL